MIFLSVMRIMDSTFGYVYILFKNSVSDSDRAASNGRKKN
jgi:hypothetical protein